LAGSTPLANQNPKSSEFGFGYRFEGVTEAGTISGFHLNENIPILVSDD
jgi:hypothetical protein